MVAAELPNTRQRMNVKVDLRSAIDRALGVNTLGKFRE